MIALWRRRGCKVHFDEGQMAQGGDESSGLRQWPVDVDEMELRKLREQNWEDLGVNQVSGCGEEWEVAGTAPRLLAWAAGQMVHP